MTTTQKADRDSWAAGDSVFHHLGRRWAVALDLSTVCLGPVDTDKNAMDAPHGQPDDATLGAEGTKVPLAPDVTDNLRQCAVCRGQFAGRADARTCGPRCRQQLRRRRAVVVS